MCRFCCLLFGLLQKWMNDTTRRVYFQTHTHKKFPHDPCHKKKSGNVLECFSANWRLQSKNIGSIKRKENSKEMYCFSSFVCQLLVDTKSISTSLAFIYLFIYDLRYHIAHISFKLPCNWAFNSWPSCLYFLSAKVTRRCHDICLNVLL